MSSYLAFRDYGTSESGKTKRVEVRSSRSGDLLALIAWHGPWRKYVAHFQSSVTFDSGCLDELSAHLASMNADHREVATDAT
jgi:hypothetical protein